MSENTALKVAVLGAGLIGVDLLHKIHRSPFLDCVMVVGRDSQNTGLRQAAKMGLPTTAGGTAALLESGRHVDLVFDASNADSHAEHWRLLEPTGALVVDLTPHNSGTPTVPTVNAVEALTGRHLSLISCGGQAAVPILQAIAQHCTPGYVEVVSTGASRSAGRATRLNLDEYIATTQDSVRAFTGTPAAKVMVNVSPAAPPPPFRVTMTVLACGIDPGTVRDLVHSAARKVRAFAPGYAVTSVDATSEKVIVAVEVSSVGGRIPAYAGNLDIINAAAIHLAETRAASPLTEGAAA
ncbi:acetylating acetaldehyde dehydrogenase [Kitasatospora aureofaciens]|uniref:Acetaldehyde dehydrogenase n=1 Tax=Kitasatospora aureofaciens TaxID=1894 RepID=A0A1E7NEB1_KITAU|nr:acetaldehyde dehydrogenase [Kitasatospora aureofaciens]ARF83271.1 acetaldehyde dehydrogenase [Kitasatospora aureofaciens]OEV39039.1 acetaldehyde dehydrogenase (acetylating) [Kitasatospora aureofaciens]GGV03669.1 acetaldehyde dehydrogenase [Kitasatospora aureofaciens]